MIALSSQDGRLEWAGGGVIAPLQAGVSVLLGTLPMPGVLGSAPVQAVNAAGGRSAPSAQVVTFGTDTGDLYDAGGSGAVQFVFAGGGDDTITGGGGNDVIYAGEGADHIRGGGGLDVIYMGAGADTVDAGSGTSYILDAGHGSDTVLNASGDVYVTVTGTDLVLLRASQGPLLATRVFGSPTPAPGARVDASNSSERVQFDGSPYDDLFIGGGGDDLLIGNAGNDTLTGGIGADEILGFAGDDLINGGAGVDVLNGGSDNDVFVFSSGAEFMTSNQIVDSVLGGDGTDTIRILADGFAINGSDLWTRASSVEVLAAGGAGTGNVNITLHASAFTAGIRVVNLAADANNTSPTVIDMSAQTDPTIGLSLIGAANSINAITGGAGSDTITGGSSNDYVMYRLSGDLADGSQLRDLIDGGTGTNFLVLGNNVGTQSSFQISAAMSWSRATNVNGILAVGPFEAQYNIALNNDAYESGLRTINLADDTSTSPSGNANIVDVSAESGSANGYDIIGSSYIDVITGGAGNDTISSGSGNDTIDGGGGVDQINAGAGVNVINGAGNGADIVTHNTAGATTTVNVSGTGLAQLIASQTGLTAVSGVGVNTTVSAALSSQRVTLTGSTGNDSLQGGSSNDTITGGNGADTITGGAGADVLTGGSGADRFVFNAVYGTPSDSYLPVNLADTITDLAAEDRIVANLSNVNAFDASSSNYVVTGRWAIQELLILDATGTNSDGGAAVGSLAIAIGTYNSATAASQVEYNISGTDAANAITGGGLNDTISGGGGNDVITGGAGGDFIISGTGINTLIYQNASDSRINNSGATAFGYDSVRITSGDVFDYSANVVAVRATQYYVGQTPQANGDALLSQLNSAYQAAGPQAGIDAIYISLGNNTNGRFLIVDTNSDNLVTTDDLIIGIEGITAGKEIALTLVGNNIVITEVDPTFYFV